MAVDELQGNRQRQYRSPSQPCGDVDGVVTADSATQLLVLLAPCSVLSCLVSQNSASDDA